MTKQTAFECVLVLANGDRIPDAFYGFDFAEARAAADRFIDGEEVTDVIFDCEL